MTDVEQRRAFHASKKSVDRLTQSYLDYHAALESPEFKELMRSKNYWWEFWGPSFLDDAALPFKFMGHLSLFTDVYTPETKEVARPALAKMNAQLAQKDTILIGNKYFTKVPLPEDLVLENITLIREGERRRQGKVAFYTEGKERSKQRRISFRELGKEELIIYVDDRAKAVRLGWFFFLLIFVVCLFFFFAVIVVFLRNLRKLFRHNDQVRYEIDGIIIIMDEKQSQIFRCSEEFMTPLPSPSSSSSPS